MDLIYCGHSHNYARTGAYNAAQAGSDQIALNVPHITSGGGGAPIYQPDYSNAKSYPHVITAWPAIEFMTFDIEGQTLTMTAYQVNGLGSLGSTVLGASPPTQLPPPASYTPIETVVLNHFTNVTPQVTATQANFVYNHTTKTYNGTVTLTNHGPALSGNIHVVLDGVLNLTGIGNAGNEYSTASPKVTSKIASNPATGTASAVGSALLTNLTLVNQTGSNNGEPMIRATTNGLASGASITVPLQFSNPTNGKIAFNPIILNE